jgi:hypothetical protein
MPWPSRCREVSENFFTELPWQSGRLIDEVQAKFEK